jgi:hypothetical protein
LVALQSVISLAVLVVVSGPSHQHLALMPISIRRPSGERSVTGVINIDI